MKPRMIASVLLIMILSSGINSKTDAAPWSGHRHGWYRPAVRVYVPPVVIGGYYGGYYGHRHYCGPRYYDRGCHGGHRHCR